jgi:hypothetical protein
MKMFDPFPVKRACPPDEPMDLIAFLEEHFRKIRAVLSIHARDKRSFHSSIHSFPILFLKAFERYP